jgi:integrase
MAVAAEASPAAPTVAEFFGLVRRWDRYLSVTDHAEKTRANYRYALLKLFADTMLDLEQIGPDEIEDYLESLASKAGTRASATRAAKSFWAFLASREGYRDVAAHLKVKSPKYGTAPALEPEELRQLVRAAFLRDKRWGWAILFAYHIGGRRTALCAIEPGDISRGIVTMRVTKGGRPYSVPLNRAAAIAARHLIAYGDATLFGCVPGTFWTWVRQAGQDAGVRAWPHLLRHTAATDLAEAEVHDSVIQAFLGHASRALLHRYTRVREPTFRRGVQALERPRATKRAG